MNWPGKILNLGLQTARLMVGQTPYNTYREHMERHHPDLAAMDEQTFFRRQQEARYAGRSGGRCC